MRISLTPGQAVTVHGWIRARMNLTWGDILENNKLTFEFLTKTCNITPTQLFSLQPSLEAWIGAERIKLEDCPNLTQWSAHPIKDFKADLGDIIKNKWNAETLKKMGITYQDLVMAGLTGATMPLMGLSLCGWTSIGFTREDAMRISPADLTLIFSMPWYTVLSGLQPKA